MKFLSTLIVLALLFSFACKEKSQEPDNPCPLNDTLLIVSQFEDIDFPDDEYSIDSIYFESPDVLACAVAYSGGCEEHCFLLGSIDSYAESQIPIASLKLFHDSNDDMCEAYPHETLFISLSPLKEHFLSFYPGSDTVALNINQNEVSLYYYVGDD